VITEEPPGGPSVLLALQRATHVTLDRLAADPGGRALPGGQANALANLADGRPRTVSELCAAAGSRPSTMTGTLDRLEERGLVARSPSRADRRAVQVALTAEGRAAAAAVAAAMARLERRALGALPAGTVTVLLTALQALAEVPHD
jgi:MarR family transcriptional regulator, organic hydroperoxide resistance regulator